MAGLRVGVVRHYFEASGLVEDEVRAAIAATERCLRAAGAVITAVSLPSLQAYQNAGLQIARSEAYAIHEKTLRENPEKYGELARRRLLMGAFLRACDYVNAQRERLSLTERMRQLMQDVDVLLLPAARKTASSFGDDMVGKQGAFFVRPFNVTGMPALVVNAGIGQGGMPIAVQLAGRPFEDLGLLAIGAFIEAELGERHVRPQLAGTGSVMESA
jgi:aspartyl-tRNA(Asn)/glutamyl-tRNA(Gln) amidotransferase subunit A